MKLQYLEISSERQKFNANSDELFINYFDAQKNLKEKHHQEVSKLEVKYEFENNEFNRDIKDQIRKLDNNLRKELQDLQKKLRDDERELQKNYREKTKKFEKDFQELHKSEKENLRKKD